MDPNECLKQIERIFFDDPHHNYQAAPPPESEAEAWKERLKEQCGYLESWLDAGGFEPEWYDHLYGTVAFSETTGFGLVLFLPRVTG